MTGYSEFGVTDLVAYDGDQDEECAARSDQVFTVDDALTIEDHPNGTLVWSPIVDKAAKLDPLVELTGKFVEAIKSMAVPTPVYITMPDIKQSDVTVSAPEVNVTTPDVHVDVHVPEQPAPNIDVHVPETEAPVVNVTTPDVHVDVHVPEQEPPNIEVNVPDAMPPNIEVHVPDAMPADRQREYPRTARAHRPRRRPGARGCRAAHRPRRCERPGAEAHDEDDPA